jgi:hypothetical protein
LNNLHSQEMCFAALAIISRAAYFQAGILWLHLRGGTAMPSRNPESLSYP